MGSAASETGIAVKIFSWDEDYYEEVEEIK